MRLSRRTYTQELKEAAVRRVELGASIGEVARACEVNPNVLHRWRRELRDHGVKAFQGNGKSRAEQTGCWLRSTILISPRSTARRNALVMELE